MAKTEMGLINVHAAAVQAGKDLARLMERELGYETGHIDNVALRLFIQAKWDLVSALAHNIHDGR
jgi:hypothetical protein